MHIEFIKNYGAYSPGDVAGFAPDAAEALVKKGVAVRKSWGNPPAPQIDAGQDTQAQADQAAIEDKTARGRRRK